MIPGALLIMLGCLAVLALIEPGFMRWLCARGLGWADAFELFKKNRVEATGNWAERIIYMTTSKGTSGTTE